MTGARWTRSYEDARLVLPTGQPESSRAPLADWLRTLEASGEDVGGLAYAVTGGHAETSNADRWQDFPTVEDWRGHGGDPSDTGCLQAAIDESGKSAEGVPLLVNNPLYTIEASILVQRSGVALIGKGCGTSNGSAAIMRTSAATRIVFDAAATPAPMIIFRSSDPAVYPNDGGGLSLMMLDGNNRATRCLSLESWSQAFFDRLHCYAATEDQIWLGCYSGNLPLGTYSTVGNLFQLIEAHAKAQTGNVAHALRLAGGQGNGGTEAGNACFNTFLRCRFNSNDADTVIFEDTDNNSLIGCRSSSTEPARYGLVFGSGDQDSSGRGDTSRFNFVVASEIEAGILAKASQTGGGSSSNNVVQVSRSNGAPLPEIETGAGGSLDATIVVTSTGAADVLPLAVLAYGNNLVLDAYHSVVLMNGVAGAGRTVTLPKAASHTGPVGGTRTKPIFIRRMDSTYANILQVLPAAGDTIEGASSMLLGPSEGRWFVSDGVSAWYTDEKSVLPQSVTTATTNQTLNYRSKVLLLDASLGNRIVTLPAANTWGAGRTVELVVRRTDAVGANTATINRAGADTINGGTTGITVAVSATARFVSDGVSAWWTL